MSTVGREGPLVRVSCSGCRHRRSEGYRIQGDSGADIYCTHSANGRIRYVGDSVSDTPDWCPLWPEGVPR
jgi:hypothetical protein